MGFLEQEQTGQLLANTEIGTHLFLGVEQIKQWTAESFCDVLFSAIYPDWMKNSTERMEANVYIDTELKTRKGKGAKKLDNIIQLFDEASLPTSRPVRIGVLGETLGH